MGKVFMVANIGLVCAIAFFLLRMWSATNEPPDEAAAIIVTTEAATVDGAGAEGDGATGAASAASTTAKPTASTTAAATTTTQAQTTLATTASTAAESATVESTTAESTAEETSKEETTMAETTTATTAASGGALSGRIVCIDAGHQRKGNSALEPVAPGSSIKKAKVSSGTQGVATGTPEYVINLAVAKKLQALLVAQGAKVVMVRETDDVDISNVERAEIGNNAGADITVRIHADGSENSSTRGMSMLVPDPSITEASIAQKSARAGKLVLESAVAATGAKNRGVVERDDMTGFNWSKVPSILIEMGFMSNPDEDRLLCDGAYQDKIAQGITDGLIAYFAS